MLYTQYMTNFHKQNKTMFLKKISLSFFTICIKLCFRYRSKMQSFKLSDVIELQVNYFYAFLKYLLISY